MKARLAIALAIAGLFSLLLSVPAVAAGGHGCGGFGGGMGGFSGGMSPGMGGHSFGSHSGSPGGPAGGGLGDRGFRDHPIIGSGGSHNWNFRDHNFDGDFRHHRHHFDNDDFLFFLNFGFPFGYPYPYYYPYPYAYPYGARNNYNDKALLKNLDARWQGNHDLLVSWSGSGQRVNEVGFGLLDKDKQLIEMKEVKSPPYTTTFQEAPGDAVYLQISLIHSDDSVDSAMRKLPK